MDQVKQLQGARETIIGFNVSGRGLKINCGLASIRAHLAWT
jgi:hypothetical protein